MTMPRAFGDRLHQVVANRIDSHHHRNGHATLAGRAVAGVDRCVSGRIHVCVRQHDHVVLRTAQGLHPHAGHRSGLVHVSGNRGGTHERDCVHPRMVKQRVDHVGSAVQHGEDALGQPGLRPAFRQDHRRPGVALRWLEDERVAAGNGHRAHPQRNHRRKIKGRYSDGHPNALSDGGDVDVGGCPLGVGARQHRRDATCKLHNFDAPLQFPRRAGANLAVLVADDHRQVVGPALQCLAKRKQHGAALGQRSSAPGTMRPPSGRHRRVDVRRRGQPNPCRHDTACGVEHVATSFAGTGPPCVAQPMVDHRKRHVTGGIAGGLVGFTHDLVPHRWF